MRKDLLLILNPLAGKGQGKNRLYEMAELFTQAGYTVLVHPTRGKGDAAEAAKGLGGRCAAVVCCGGDGTLNETVNGLMELTRRPRLGYIPAGTTNDLAASLKLSRKWNEAARTVISGTPFDYDIGRFGSRYFTYIAAFGAFTEVSYTAPQTAKNVFGRLAYVLEGVKHLGNIHPVHLTVAHDSGQFEGEFIFGAVTNSTSVAGFKGYPTPDVMLDDGCFEALFIKQPRSPADLQRIIGALRRQTYDEQWMHYFHTSRLEAEGSASVPWTLDGEYGGQKSRVVIENCRKALRILVDPAFRDTHKCKNAAARKNGPQAPKAEN